MIKEALELLNNTIQLRMTPNGLRIVIDVTDARRRAEDAVAVYIQRIVLSARGRGKTVYGSVDDLFETSRERHDGYTGPHC